MVYGGVKREEGRILRVVDGWGCVLLKGSSFLNQYGIGIRVGEST